MSMIIRLVLQRGMVELREGCNLSASDWPGSSRVAPFDEAADLSLLETTSLHTAVHRRIKCPPPVNFLQMTFFLLLADHDRGPILVCRLGCSANSQALPNELGGTRWPGRRPAKQ